MRSEHLVVSYEWWTHLFLLSRNLGHFFTDYTTRNRWTRQPMNRQRYEKFSRGDNWTGGGLRAYRSWGLGTRRGPAAVTSMLWLHLLNIKTCTSTYM